MKFLVFALLVAAVAAEEAARPERSAVWGVPAGVVGVPGLVAPGVLGVHGLVGPSVVSTINGPVLATSHVRLVRSAPEESARPERSAVWGVPAGVVGVPSIVGVQRVVGVPSVVGVPRLVAGPGLIAAPGLVGIHG